MKARNPSTGNLENVYVKALDSLPVGTEVDFNGSVSDIPVGWEAISGQNKIKKTSNTRAIAGKALNVASESTTDAYSCDYINDLISIQTFDISLGTFTALGEKFNQIYDLTIPAGYTPLGVFGFKLTGSGFTQLAVNGLYLDAGKIKYSIKNTQNNATGGSITFTVYVAFIKSS